MATPKLDIFAPRRPVTVTCSVLTLDGPVAALAAAGRLHSLGARVLAPGPASLQTTTPAVQGKLLVRLIRLG